MIHNTIMVKRFFQKKQVKTCDVYKKHFMFTCSKFFSKEINRIKILKVDFHSLVSMGNFNFLDMNWGQLFQRFPRLPNFLLSCWFSVHEYSLHIAHLFSLLLLGGYLKMAKNRYHQKRQKYSCVYVILWVPNDKM